MAATLIEIKSKMLLPKEIVAEDEEESKTRVKELVRPSARIRKIQIASQMLYERVDRSSKPFSRAGRSKSDENNLEINATVFDMLTVFQKIVVAHKEEVQMEIEREEISLAEMLKDLKQAYF